MADEIIPSGITDIVAGEVMANEYLMLLADRDGSILTHPALLHATGSANSSNVVRVPHYGLGGYNLLSATTPGAEVANTALTDGHTDVTVAMRAKRYTLDDLARIMVDGKLDPVAFAQDAAVSVAMTLISLIANVTDGFGSTAGSSGVDATWNDVVDAKTILGIAKAAGPLLGILHPRQWGDLEIDALSLGVLPAQTMAGVINQGVGGAYKGRWMGIDFYVSSEVPTADGGANRAGGILAPGGVAWADKSMAPEGDPNIIDLGRARLERVRQGTFVATSYLTSYACGVSLAIDAAGVTLKTDA